MGPHASLLVAKDMKGLMLNSIQDCEDKPPPHTHKVEKQMRLHHKPLEKITVPSRYVKAKRYKSSGMLSLNDLHEKLRIYPLDYGLIGEERNGCIPDPLLLSTDRLRTNSPKQYM